MKWRDPRLYWIYEWHLYAVVLTSLVIAAIAIADYLF